MKNKLDTIEVSIPTADGSDIAERVSVTVPLRWDDELKEWLLTEDAHRIIDCTKARHMGLLSPSQLKELRQRFGFSQKEMGELFQVGEKSWTRWETGKHRPTRSINLLLRGVYERELSVDYLLRMARKQPTEKTQRESAIKDWKHIGRISEIFAPDIAPEESSSANVAYSRHQTQWSVDVEPSRPCSRVFFRQARRRIYRMDRKTAQDRGANVLSERLATFSVG